MTRIQIPCKKRMTLCSRAYEMSKHTQLFAFANLLLHLSTPPLSGRSISADLVYYLLHPQGKEAKIYMDRSGFVDAREYRAITINESELRIIITRTCKCRVFGVVC